MRQIYAEFGFKCVFLMLGADGTIDVIWVVNFGDYIRDNLENSEKLIKINLESWYEELKWVKG